MPFDALLYLRCQDCGEFVVEGESAAHERSCRRVLRVCRVCGDRVNVQDLRDHLIEHNAHAAGFEPEEVREQYEEETG